AEGCDRVSPAPASSTRLVRTSCFWLFSAPAGGRAFVDHSEPASNAVSERKSQRVRGSTHDHYDSTPPSASPAPHATPPDVGALARRPPRARRPRGGRLPRRPSTRRLPRRRSVLHRLRVPHHAPHPRRPGARPLQLHRVLGAPSPTPPACPVGAP